MMTEEKIRSRWSVRQPLIELAGVRDLRWRRGTVLDQAAEEHAGIARLAKEGFDGRQSWFLPSACIRRRRCGPC